MTAVFDAYVMVDWSAASRPVTGANSIWIASLERGHAQRVDNPPTRDAAMALLADLLSDMVARGLSVLVGCDFCFGFPQGFLARTGARDWRELWRRLGTLVDDRSDNANRRFAAAAALNAQVSGDGGPFWGCPAVEVGPHLSATKPAAFALPERRLAETRLPGATPVWQMFYNGSVGGQTLTGLPRLESLTRHPWLGDAVRVWPFETGLKPLSHEAGRVVLAEIYPSLVPAAPDAVKDRAQVRAVVQWAAGLDEAGRLGALFAGDPSLSPEQRRAVENEEGWVLGAPNRVDLHGWIKDPEEIYRHSFATIRDEVALDAVPADLRDVVVRVVHACGMTEVAAELAWSDGAGEAGRAALKAGKPILVDAEMVARGIIVRRLPAANPVVCTLNDPRVPELAKQQATTRSAAAVDLWRDRLDGAIVAVGNAPTALFRLLQMILEEGAPRPALILGFAVGFVGAAESKEALIQSGLPFVAVRGRKGVSAMAAAAVNALAGEMEG